MTHLLSVPHNNRGFTLIETIVYIGLFGIMMGGIFVSVYPLFTGAERLTRTIVTEGEVAFVLAKIHFALADTITSTDGVVAIPHEGASTHELSLTYDGAESYRFELDTSNSFCTPPRVCSQLTLREVGNDPLPLNSERVSIENFTVEHIVDGSSRYLNISFTANEKPVGPIRYYLRF